MYGQANFIDLMLIVLFGGAAGGVAHWANLGSGRGLFWDVVGGILGGFLGAFTAYFYHINEDGFGAVIGVTFLGSVFFLFLLRLLSVYQGIEMNKNL
jgi:uncharacterized membrane protein YeaQ/YmgE (transglycosylase-associated protein family)